MKMALKINFGSLLIAMLGVGFWACESESDVSTTVEDPLLEVAEVASQSASGMEISFRQGTSSSDRPYGGRYGGGSKPAIAKEIADQDLRVIMLAESFGERRSFRMLNSIAEITHFDEEGNEVEVDFGDRESRRGSWRSEDSPKVAKTVIDLGDGQTISRRGGEFTVSGKVVIDRSFADDQLTETIDIQNVNLNGAVVSGTKTIIRSFDEEQGQGSSNMTLSDGQIVFADGTIGSWQSQNSRRMTVEVVEGEKPTSAHGFTTSETTITLEDGSVIYAHKIVTPLEMDMECGRRKPKSGELETTFKENFINIDFGENCDGGISIIINGEEIELG